MLICTQGAPSNDTVFETLLLVSSLKRNGAKSISLYMPYCSYARQDKMTGPWRSLAFSDLATYYENSGVDRVVTLDIHNEATMGCFSQSINATNMTAVELAARYISDEANLKNLVVLSPDEGGVKRAKRFFDAYQSLPHNLNLDARFVIMLKKREKPNEVAGMTITGDVVGRDCILIDDMIDTGVYPILT
jgi:ribose-phosphate pyrophosphokinase